MQDIRKRGLSVIAAAVLLIAAAVSCVIASFGSTHAAEDYHTWRQADERWGGVSMNGTTVARSGCLITSLSIMIMHTKSLDSSAMSNLGISNESQFNPGVLANAYRNRGGFTYGGGIASWGMISQIVPKVTFIRDSNLSSYGKSQIASEIKSMLDSGLHVIVNVNGHHWVYIEGVRGNDIYMIDPASDKKLLYDEYDMSGGNEYWALKCANPPHLDQTTTKATTTQPPTEPTTEPYIEPVEYHCNVLRKATIFKTSSVSPNKVAFVKGGSVLKVTKTENNMGLVVDPQKDGTLKEIGWIKLSDLSEVSECRTHTSGDINNDHALDMYDVALLSEYLSTKEEYYDWAPMLRQCELEAADVNGDGKVNRDDLIFFLGFLCA